MHALAATNQSSCLPLDLLASIPMQYAETLLFLLAHYAVPLQRDEENSEAHHFGHAGCTEEYKDIWMGAVHVEDVALAHLLVFENPSASGRHICAESINHLSDFAAKLTELYPSYKVPK